MSQYEQLLFFFKNTHSKDIKGPENQVFELDGRVWCVNHDSSDQAQFCVASSSKGLFFIKPCLSVLCRKLFWIIDNIWNPSHKT